MKIKESVFQRLKKKMIYDEEIRGATSISLRTLKEEHQDSKIKLLQCIKAWGDVQEDLYFCFFLFFEDENKQSKLRQKYKTNLFKTSFEINII